MVWIPLLMPRPERRTDTVVAPTPPAPPMQYTPMPPPDPRPYTPVDPGQQFSPAPTSGVSGGEQSGPGVTSGGGGGGGGSRPYTPVGGSLPPTPTPVPIMPSPPPSQIDLRGGGGGGYVGGTITSSKLIEPTRVPGVIVTDYDPKITNLPAYQNIYYTSNLSFIPSSPNSIVIYTDKQGRLTGKTSDEYYDLSEAKGQYVNREELAKFIKENPLQEISYREPTYTLIQPSSIKEPSPISSVPKTATMPSAFERTQGFIESKTGFRIPSASALYTRVIRGQEEVSPIKITQTPVDLSRSILRLGDVPLDLTERAVMKLPISDYKVVTAPQVETRFFSRGTGVYNPLDKTLSTPTTTLPSEFDRQILFTPKTTLAKTSRFATLLGLYSTPYVGTTLLGAGLVSGTAYVSEGIKTGSVPTVAKGIFEAAPGTLYFGFKGASFLYKDITRPRIKVIDPASRLDPKFIEIQKFDDLGKIYGKYQAQQVTLPPNVRIENRFFTLYEGPLGKPKTYLAETPVWTKLGDEPFVLSQRLGARYGTVLKVSKGEGDAIISEKLFRFYPDKKNLLGLPPGRRITTEKVGLFYQPPVQKSIGEITKVRTLSQDISLPSPFRKLSPKQEASFEFDKVMKNLLGREYDASKYFKQYPRRKMTTSTGQIVRLYPGEASKVNFVKGTGTKSSGSYLKSLYPEQTQLLKPANIAPKPSYPSKKQMDVLLKQYKPKEINLDVPTYIGGLRTDSYSQYRYGFGYGEFGSYKEDIRNISVPVVKEIGLSSVSIKPDFKLSSDISQLPKTSLSTTSTQTRFNEIIKEDISQIQPQKINVRLRQDAATRVNTIPFRPVNTVPFRPTRVPRRPIKIVPDIDDDEDPIRKSIMGRGRPGKFIPEIRRSGKFIPLKAQDNPLAAKNIAKSIARSTLAASIRVRGPKGYIQFSPTNDFGLAKRDPTILVQRKTARLGSFGERREIVKSRKGGFGF